MTSSKFHQDDYRSNTMWMNLTNATRLVTAFAVMSLGSPCYAYGLSKVDNSGSRPAVQKHAPINTPPSAQADFVDLDKASTAFNVLANDGDAEGDRLMVIEANAKFGAVAFTPEGFLAYVQEAGASRSDEIRYTVIDGRGGLDTGLVEIAAP